MSNRLLASQPIATELAFFLLRVTFGCLFVYHGYTKLVAYNDIAPHFPDLIGIGGKLSFILVIFAELICGFCVAIGLLTRLTIIPIFITMIVVVFLAHAKDPFKIKELPVLFLALSVVIFLLGSGKASVDKLILKK